MTTTYRADIDGLRAVAVLSVLLYHAFPAALRGGFVGVDVFFVISGFLITEIILRGLRDGTFRFRVFYARRVRRLFPALSVVLLASLIVGWLILFPVDFHSVAVHVLAGAGFYSNLALWHESGYFDTASELKPLLHLWSLGVEEQYYLIWPVLLVLANRTLHRILPLIGVVAAVSFALNVLLVAAHPSATFYSPPTRFWELMIGSALAYVQVFRAAFGESLHKRGNVLATIGAAMLLAALIVTNESKYPGWPALLPTLGTACVIAAGPAAVFNRLLSWRPLVYIGLISYPLYLWHWPLLTYLRIFFGGVPPPLVRWVALGASVLLAHLTYRFIEIKLRSRWRDWVVPGLSAAMGAVAGCAALVITGDLSAASASVPHLAEVSAAISDWEGSSEWIPGDSKRAVMFFGDSYMQELWPRIEQVAREHKAPIRSVVFHVTGGCAPILGIERLGYDCERFTESGYARAQQPDVDTVVFSCSWLGFLNRTDYIDVSRPHDPPLDLHGPRMDVEMHRFEESLRQLKELNKQIVILVSPPRDPMLDPARMLRRDGLMHWTVHLSEPVSRAKIEAVRAEIDPRLRKIASDIGATIIDPMDVLCSQDWCPALDESGRPLFKDAFHLRASTARERFEVLDQFIYLPPASVVDAQ